MFLSFLDCRSIPVDVFMRSRFSMVRFVAWGRWSWKRNLFFASFSTAACLLLLTYTVLLNFDRTAEDELDSIFKCPLEGDSDGPRDHQHLQGNATANSVILHPKNAVGYFGDYILSEKQLRSARVSRHTKNVNCAAMFNGNEGEMTRAYDYMTSVQPQPQPLNALDYIEMTEDCESFRSERGYILRPMSRDEEEFPIAFSILMYRDIEQMERMLRAIYAPQNAYCIHVDRKVS